MTITIAESSLNPWVSDLGKLVNLLTVDTADSDKVDLNADWFANPFLGNSDGQPGNIPGYSMRPGQLMRFLADVLGEPADDMPELTNPGDDTIDLKWYSINWRSKPTNVYAVLSDPKHEYSDDDAAYAGVGLWHEWSWTPEGNVVDESATDADSEPLGTLKFYMYFPLYSFTSTASPVFRLGKAPTDGDKEGTPILVTVEIHTNDKFTSGATTYTTMRLQGRILLDGSSPGFNIEFLNGTDVVDGFDTLQALLQNSVSDWINVAIQTPYVTDWLNKGIGESNISPGELLEDILLLQEDGTQDGKTKYAVADLETNFQSVLDGTTSAVTVGEQMIANVLKTLSGLDGPLLKLGNDGLYVVALSDSSGDDSEADSSVTDYGLRLRLPDMKLGRTSKSKKQEKEEKDTAAGASEDEGDNDPDTGADTNKPQLTLQIGQWLTGEDDDDSWIHRCDPDGKTGKPGITFMLATWDADSQSASFKPRLEFTSVGFNYVGGNGNPLIDVHGFRLKGFELRGFAALNLSSEPDFTFGGAIRLDNIGIPLGTSYDSSSDEGTDPETDGDDDSDVRVVVKGQDDAQAAADSESEEGNPVAANLVASGDGKGGNAAQNKTDAVNPEFSVSASYVYNQNLSVLLYDPNDAQTDTVWFPIQKTLGPLNCKQIGVGWDDSSDILSFLFDGGVSLLGLTVDLMSLSVGIPVTDPTNLSGYSLGLAGVGIDFQAGPVEIGGALLKNDQATPVDYEGQALVKAWKVGFQAFGAYAKADASDGGDGYTSLFVFALIDVPIGGPGFFFVTGFSGGFGYNRSLTIPAPNEVYKFPLVSGIGDPSQLGAKGGDPPTPLEALATLEDWVHPSRGEYWAAGGIQFTTYDIINSNALLVVEFGTNIEIAVIGLSKVQLPQSGLGENDIVFAYAELQLELVVDVSSAEFLAAAVLSPNSYLLTKECSLSGGFALYVWFPGNPHSGEFVMTIGGYHPAFEVPDYYPQEPRVSFSVGISNEISLKGDAYFALTPSCIMTGAGLQFLFDDKTIGIAAWFNANVDAVLGWCPFFFDVHASVSVGVSYQVDCLGVKKTLKIEASGTLDLFSPPLCGQITIDCWLFDLPISWGGYPPNEGSNTVGWDQFATLLPAAAPAPSTNNDVRRSLPPVAAVTGPSKPRTADVPATQDNGSSLPDAVVQVTLQDGQLGSVPQTDGSQIWVVRADHFVFSTSTAVPATSVSCLGETVPTGDATTSYGIKPMGIDAVTSAVHTLTITDPNSNEMQASDFDFELETGSVPFAMWGSEVSNSQLLNESVIDDLIIGITRITSKEQPLTGPDAFSIKEALTMLQVATTGLPLDAGAAPPTSGSPVTSSDTQSVIQSTVMEVADVRTELFNAISALGVDPGINGDLTYLQQSPGTVFLGSPMQTA